MNPVAGLLLLALAATAFAVWIYALLSALRNERLDSTMKLTWVLVVIFVSGLGALLYLVFAPDRPNRPKRHERDLADLERRRRSFAAQAKRAQPAGH